jgi:hypothetical protein
MTLELQQKINRSSSSSSQPMHIDSKLQHSRWNIKLWAVLMKLKMVPEDANSLDD